MLSYYYYYCYLFFHSFSLRFGILSTFFFHSTLFFASCCHASYLRLISAKSTLTVSSHLFRDLPIHLVTLGFPTRSLKILLSPVTLAACPAHPVLRLFISLNILCSAYLVSISLLYSLHNSPFTLSRFPPYIPFSTLHSNTLNAPSYSAARANAPRPYKITDNMMILCM